VDGLSAVTRNEIAKVLDATFFTQQGFAVKYADGDNSLVSVAFPPCPEYRFVISSTGNADVFTTIECPGIHTDAAETIQRNDLESCIHAIKDWAERITDMQKDSIIDEFGGEGG
jgi:hypothetical protein